MSKNKSGSGKVYLVGAGPGDLGLVTLRAKECIEDADVIIYDHLANPQSLGWARDDAEIIYVGKAAKLTNRVRQYFQKSRNRDPKTEALVAEIHDTDWMVVESEIEALFLEAEMIRRYEILGFDCSMLERSSSFVRCNSPSRCATSGLLSVLASAAASGRVVSSTSSKKIVQNTAELVASLDGRTVIFT